MSSWRTPLVALCWAVCAGCNEAEPRPQFVVFVDIDLPVPGQLAGRPELSPDAAVDTLRVDLLSDGGALQSALFVAPEAANWPVSFGIEGNEVAQARPVQVRIRAFRGTVAAPGEDADGLATLDPPAGATIDRRIDLGVAGEGIERVRVVLRGDCLAVPSKFGPEPTTCLDGATRQGSPAAGMEVLGEEVPPSEVGSWSGANEIPCSLPQPEDTECVEGGFSILGDPRFVGVVDLTLLEDSAPLRAITVRPFYMDRTELTVGRLRALVASGRFTATLPVEQDNPAMEEYRFCTWRGLSDPTNDDLPVNCLPYASAEAACDALGGTLPTEAQWEHAARGRGRRYLYPWGDAPVSCCAASVQRNGLRPMPQSCPGPSIEAAGSHPPTAACDGIGDVSFDGVIDLAGSVTEALRDTLVPLDHAECWAKDGILHDPVCLAESAKLDFSGRGGSWASGSATAAAPLRRGWAQTTASDGLRCVYAASSTGVPE